MNFIRILPPSRLNTEQQPQAPRSGWEKPSPPQLAAAPGTSAAQGELGAPSRPLISLWACRPLALRTTRVHEYKGHNFFILQLVCFNSSNSFVPRDKSHISSQRQYLSRLNHLFPWFWAKLHFKSPIKIVVGLHLNLTHRKILSNLLQLCSFEKQSSVPQLHRSASPTNSTPPTPLQLYHPHSLSSCQNDSRLLHHCV